MRALLTTTCLTPIVLLGATGSVHAQTVVDTARTTPIATSTAKAGAADDIRITSAGSIKPASGIAVAVTVDSNNKVNNEGTIQITNVDDAAGISVAAGRSGGIASSGTITIDETYEPADADKDGDLDGPFAVGARRAGIRTLGTFTGDIVNTGKITVEGNDSTGIALGGALTGALTTSGAITVVGDRSVGVRTGDITGPVRLAGTIAAQGRNASAAVIGGDITGALVVQGTLVATGYRATTAPTDTSKLDADDLLQGGPALSIAGNVSGGVILAIAPKDANPNDADEDKDGIPDASEGAATVMSYGAAAAVQVGASDRSVTLGAVAGTANGHGLIIDGGVQGAGTYAGVDGNGLVVGGLGGAVTIAGGLTVSGTVQASSNGANATAIRVGSGASVPEIRISGSVNAQGGGVATARSTAVAVDAGASVAALRNSGQIKATASGADGNATAIVDRSGGLTLIENSGSIAASGALATSTRNIAIDLSSNTTGATVRQTAVAAGVTAPSIAGDIVFGSGNDVLDLADGAYTGTARYGAGANRLALSGDAAFTGGSQFGSGNDTVVMGGTSTYGGTIDFGGGADTMTLSGTAAFKGTLANSQGLALRVDGGTMTVTNAGAVALASLNVGATGVLGIAIDPTTGASTLFQVGGEANFTAGSKVAVSIGSIARSEGRYVILNAGTITGASNLTTANTVLPFLYKSSVVATAPTQLAIDITRKTASELGLNRSAASAYQAIYAAIGQDAKVADAYLGLMDGDSFRATVRQMLPDHAGGSFEAVTQGTRALGRMMADPQAPFADQGKWGYWLQQVTWGSSKGIGDTAAFNVTGWGAGGGAEAKTGVGNFGLSVGYLFGRNGDRGTTNEVIANQVEGAAYWRGTWGGFHAQARGSFGRIGFAGSRNFNGKAGTETVTRSASSRWNGTLVGASAGASYEHTMGMFTLRPIAAIDYYRLNEDGYAETGGGKAFNLTVDGRTSEELAVSGSLAAALNFGGYTADESWSRFEVEAGRRQIVNSTLGDTVARFEGGQSFALAADRRTSGWVGRLRASGGTTGFRISGEASAEQQQDYVALALRISLQMGL